MIAQRLAKIRQVMQAQQIDALIVPSADPHMSEYLPDYYQLRRWVSGFTGSVGTAVITTDFAHLWADSRYWVQAEMQLKGTEFSLQKLQLGQGDYADFLAQHLPEGAKVYIDGQLCAVNEYQRLQAIFQTKNIRLVTEYDLISPLWQERPALPNQPIWPMKPEFIGETSKTKLTKIRQKMTALGADYHLLSSLDDIAWVTNLRGSDVSFNPVFLAHLLMSQSNGILFVEQSKLTTEAKLALQQAGIATADYAQIGNALAQISGSILIDPNKVAQGVIANLPDHVRLITQTAPSTLFKAVKTDSELAHLRQAMEQDGVALCEFFVELEQRLLANEPTSELDITHLLTQFRQKQPHYISPSFDTIAGFLGNGAVVHYKANNETNRSLHGNGLLLIDSGAQYENGTTDITRMFAVGTISTEEKRAVTLVLKAHIALAQAHFPQGLHSPKLDILTRHILWQQGLDYGHGTGHGVGYCLNVHEGPQVIMHLRPCSEDNRMQVGMITSNEPGLYFTNKFGVRIENLVVNIPAQQTEFGEFLKFETLTLCPIDTRLILPELLTQSEKDWLNDYHRQVCHRLQDKVVGKVKDWLLARTQPI